MIELQERVAMGKNWLKELERSVYWQREEYRRVEKAMGRKKSGQSGSVGGNTKKVVTHETGGQDEGSVGAAGGSGLGFAGHGGFAAAGELGGQSGFGPGGDFGGQSGYAGQGGFGEGSGFAGGPSGLAGGLSSFGGLGGFGAASGLGGGQSGLGLGGGSGLFDGLELSEDADEEALWAQLAGMNASIVAEGQGQGQGQGEVLRQKDYARERWSSGKQSRLPTQEEWEEMFGKGVSSVVSFAYLVIVRLGFHLVFEVGLD